VDIVTHGLASFAITRALFPRADRPVIAAAVVAGCAADADWLALYFGPATALFWRGTYFHSLLAAVLLVPLMVIPLLAILAGVFSLKAARTQETGAGHVRVSALLFAPLCAALLHVGMDACQSQGVMLLWPFTAKRFAADWLPPIDPWILTVLMLAIAIPELLRLVSSEIGAKSKRPRGQLGALVGLLLLLAYIGLRCSLHANAVGLMESRLFHGESARRTWAYPEPLALLTWHGIAETESALNEIDVNLASTGTFDADTSLQIFKPESSPALEAARKTRVAKEFLTVAQVPKASVEKTDVGYVVILRDLRYAASGETRREIAALIELDPDANVTAQEFVWARELRNSR
jgi:LexA-binding, inner membrane-associated putative hydrolase